MNNLSKRLKTIRDIVLREQSKGIIDVGCDHALMDIYLYLKDSSLNIVASDNKKDPLDSALENLKMYDLEDKIKLSLSDGIESINDDIDTVIISGMGTETIIKILKNDNIKHVKRMIISSNNKYPLLRKEITKLGFKINYEEIIFDKKYYIVIEFIRGKENYTDEELEFGPYLLRNKDEVFKEYYLNLLNKYENIINKISNKKLVDIKNEINKIKEILK